MGFSKGVKRNEKIEEFDPYRAEHDEFLCSYPNCHKPISREEDAVVWTGAKLGINEFAQELSPLARLALTSNPSDWVDKYGYYSINLAFHTECAAEFGMHLIKDALVDAPKVGNILRQSRKDNDK